VEGGIVRALPKTGGTRSPQYYEPIGGQVWDTFLAAVQAVSQEVYNVTAEGSGHRVTPDTRRAAQSTD
jgi:hypothetical protein